MGIRREPIDELLLARGLKPVQLAAAREQAERSGVSLIEGASRTDGVDGEVLARAVADASGLPFLAEVDIDQKEMRTNRSGIKFLKKVLSDKVENQLEVRVDPLAKLDRDTKLHLDLMPSTCLLHKSMLYFLSGFMNYKARELIQATAGGRLRQPAGDHVIASFPRIMDCPDIWEELNAVWNEDIHPLIEGKRFKCKDLAERVKETVSRLYPILHSDDFAPLNECSNNSAVGNPTLLQKRQKLIQSALRHGAIHKTKVKVDSAPYQLTSFKPFNVREIEYDVWDSSKGKQDRFIANFKQIGLTGQQRAQRPQASSGFDNRQGYNDSRGYDNRPAYDNRSPNQPPQGPTGYRGDSRDRRERSNERQRSNDPYNSGLTQTRKAVRFEDNRRY